MAKTALTTLQKIAVLLKGMPPRALEELLRRLPSHAARIQAELGKLDSSANFDQLRNEVFAELKRDMQMASPASGPSKSAGATPPASASPAPVSPPVIDIRVEGPVEIRPRVNIDPAADPLQSIAKMPPDLLAAALERENSRTISLLLNSLDLEVAAQVYRRLSPTRLKEVSARFTQQGTVPEEVLRRIALAVLQNCKAIAETKETAPTDQSGRDKRIAALLRGLEREARMEMLKVVEESDADMAVRIKSMLYSFEDILRMENASVQKLLSDVDTKSLALSMSTAEPDIQMKLLSNLSKRAQESIKEEMEMIGTPTPAKVKPARQSIVEAIQRLDERGELNLTE